MSSHCSRFVSWNSSTMTSRNRSWVASRTADVVAEQVARRELQVLEVDDGLATLRRRVLGAEALEQLLQEIAIVSGQLLECRALDASSGRTRTTRRARLGT